MAICKMGPVVGGISGRLGGVVFAGGRSGVVAKSAGRRVGGQTQRAMLAKSVPSAVAGAWNALGDSQRNAWRTAAASVTRTNRLGIGRQLSGYQLYWSVVATRYGSSPPAAFLPPANLLEVRPAWLNGSFWSGGPYVIYSYGDPWPTTVPMRYVYVHRMRGASQVGGFDRPIRVAVGSKAGLGEDVYAAVVASGVDLLAGERIGLGVRWQISTGIVGGFVWVPLTVDQSGAVIEDWETGNLSAYSGDTAGASLVMSPVHGGQSALKMTHTAAGNVIKKIVATDKVRGVPVQGLVTECWVRQSSSTYDFGILFGVQDSSNFYGALNYRASPGIVLVKCVAGAYTTIASGSVNAPGNDTWYKLRVGWSAAGAITVTVLSAAGAILGSVGGNSTTYTKGGIGYLIGNVGGSAAMGYWDDWTVINKL